MEIKDVAKVWILGALLSLAVTMGMVGLSLKPQTVLIVSVINVWGFFLLGLIYEVIDN